MTTNPHTLSFQYYKQLFISIHNKWIYLIHTKMFEKINIIYKFQSIVKFWCQVMVSSLNLCTQTIAQKRYKVTIHNGITEYFDGWSISHISTLLASTLFLSIYPLFVDFSETVRAYLFSLLHQTRYWRLHSNRNCMYVSRVVQITSTVITYQII